MGKVNLLLEFEHQSRWLGGWAKIKIMSFLPSYNVYWELKGKSWYCLCREESGNFPCDVRTS